MRTGKYAAAAASALLAAASATVLTAPAASADPFACYGNAVCAKVTAIEPGSYLVLHNEPNYSGGARPHSPHLHNGDVVVLYCYLTGAPDADGHGDTYWWFGGSESAGVAGYLNDYYLTTGVPSAFRKWVGHCP
jgi:hypothetical protein